MDPKGKPIFKAQKCCVQQFACCIVEFESLDVLSDALPLPVYL
jgi:hypothetical protein